MPKERTFMLSEMKINDYIDLLASDAPAPGGGSASALCGAQGAGLCAMVAAKRNTRSIRSFAATFTSRHGCCRSACAR